LRNILKTVIVIGLAVGLIAFFLRNADLGRVWASVRAARPDYLLFSLGLTGVSFLIRAERWQYLLAPLGPTRFWVVFRTTVIGFGASAVLPARAGEVIRPYLLARREGILLDPTYTAKGMTGMLETIKSGGVRPGAVPLFVHTGGAFGLLARTDLFKA
jgi:uncharacterized membrane protein YbhN (UPF0104 family)